MLHLSLFLYVSAFKSYFNDTATSIEHNYDKQIGKVMTNDK